MLGSNANWLYFSLQLFSSSLPYHFVQFSSVQFSHSVVSHSLWPYIAAHQAFLSITNSQSLLKLTSIKSVMPSNHLILCRPFHLPPSIFPSIRVFSNESVLCIRWPNIGVSASVSVLPMNIQGWSPCSPRDSQESSPAPQFESLSSQNQRSPSSWSNSYTCTWLLAKQ